MANEGRFVWHEHLTTDTPRSIAFYGEVVGWKTQPFGDDGSYTMWVSEQGPLGGVMALPPEARQMGAPPSWIGHVQVADVDATAARAVELGGKLHQPPTDVPTVGRFAVIGDPQGATISVFEPAGDMPLHDLGKDGEIGWNELVTSDDAAALAFYGELLGWKVQSTMDMGPLGTYSLFGVGETMLGGVMKTPPDAPMPPTWIFYANTSDLDAAAARVKSHGGQVVNGPMEVPGGRVVQIMDPVGAAFALHQQTTPAS
jgi:hypothetical protein